MATITARDPVTAQTYTFNLVAALHGAMSPPYNYVPLRADGTPFAVNKVAGGFVIDGAPLNVWIDGVWYIGQKELLAPMWAAGTVPTPSAAILAGVPVPMPPAVAANWAAYQASQNEIFGIPTPIFVIGAGLAALWFLK